jgi:BirA family biotin operon repressor/biotin-[acetyl-CoA-carboxylase] ligase
LALKWPNDLLWSRRKLAGLLLEVRGESSGPTQVIVGLGLNVRMAPRAAVQIEQPWAALEQMSGLAPYSRNRLVALLVSELAAAMKDFGASGLAPFLADWAHHDPFRGEPIRLTTGLRQIEGEYLGIAPDGALRLAVDGRILCYHAGEVSLFRPMG